MTGTSRMNFRDDPTVSLEAPAPPLRHVRPRRRIFPNGWQDARDAAATVLLLVLAAGFTALFLKLGGALMGDRYVYTDTDHDSLVINAHTDVTAGPVAAVKTGGTVYVTRDALPEITAALYEATGLPAPIILGRPELAGTHTRVGFATVGPDPGTPGRLKIDGFAGSLDPVMARELARYLVARAEQAESEPDPAEVEALVLVLDPWRADHIPGPVRTTEEAARAILRAGYRPPERKGGAA